MPKPKTDKTTKTKTGAGGKPAAGAGAGAESGAERAGASTAGDAGARDDAAGDTGARDVGVELGAGTPIERLEGLLKLWEKLPAWPVAEAVMAADAALGLPAFAGTTDDWVAQAKRAKLGERGPLLATLAGKTMAETTERLEAIASWATDPRTICAVEQLIGSPPWTSDSSKPTWSAVFELIAQSRSARFVEIAGRLIAAWQVRDYFKAWLQNQLKRALRTLPVQAPGVSAALAAELARVVGELRPAAPTKAAPPRDAQSLLAEIYARPHDDGPRLVYADLLQERGDPRGEFIALQIAGGDPKRQKALLKQHGKAWLGPIAPVLGAGVEFRRGFPARGMIKLKHRADADKFADLVEWATLEDLTWSHVTPIPRGQEPHVRRVGAHMRGLRRAYGAWAPDLLAATQPWELEELEVGLSGPDEIKLLIESPLLPKLKRLIIDDRGDLSWFANVASLRGIETIEFYPEDLSGTLRLLSRYPSVQTYRAGRWLTATRGSDHQLSRITLHLDAHTVYSGANLLNALDDGLAEAIELDLADGVAPRSQLVELARAKLRGTRPSFFERAPSTALPPLSPLRGLAFRPDGSIVVMDRSQVVIIDATGQHMLSRFPVTDCHACQLIQRGTQLVAVGHNRVGLFDLATGRDLVRAEPKVEDSDAYLIAVSADERYVTISNDQVFDLEARRELPAPRGAARAHAVRPDFASWVTGKGHDRPRELMQPGSTKKLVLDGSAGARRFRYFGDAVIGQTDTAVIKWNADTGERIATCETNAIQKVLVSGGDRYLLVVESKRVVIVDIASFAIWAIVPERLWWVAIDPSGQRLVSVDNADYQVSVRPVVRCA